MSKQSIQVSPGVSKLINMLGYRPSSKDHDTKARMYRSITNSTQRDLYLENQYGKPMRVEMAGGDVCYLRIETSGEKIMVQVMRFYHGTFVSVNVRSLFKVNYKGYGLTKNQKTGQLSESNFNGDLMGFVDINIPMVHPSNLFPALEHAKVVTPEAWDCINQNLFTDNFDPFTMAADGQTFFKK